MKNDLDSIEKMINDEDYKANTETRILINSEKKIGKQIRMVFDFLKFCKSFLHPYVHASKKGIDFYLLPRSVFSSNLKYADFIFSLTDNLKGNKAGENVDAKKVNIDDVKIDDEYKLYEEKKILKVNKALEILLSKKINLLNEIDINKIQEKKKFQK